MERKWNGTHPQGRKSKQESAELLSAKIGKVFTYPTGGPQDFWTFSIFENLLKGRKLILKRITRDGTCIAKRICQAVPTERPKIENPKVGSKFDPRCKGFSPGHPD